MVDYNPHITGQYNPLYVLNNQGFLIAQYDFCSCFFLLLSGKDCWAYMDSFGQSWQQSKPHFSSHWHTPYKTISSVTSVGRMLQRFRPVLFKMFVCWASAENAIILSISPFPNKHPQTGTSQKPTTAMIQRIDFPTSFITRSKNQGQRWLLWGRPQRKAFKKTASWLQQKLRHRWSLFVGNITPKRCIPTNFPVLIHIHWKGLRPMRSLRRSRLLQGAIPPTIQVSCLLPEGKWLKEII